MEVAPYTGAWIEMFLSPKVYSILGVAPYTGAWIEILILSLQLFASAAASHPTRVRGLKSVCGIVARSRRKSHHTRVRGLKSVISTAPGYLAFCRTLHGCVD